MNRYMDSWDYCASAQIRATFSGPVWPTVTPTVGRRGTQALTGAHGDAYAGFWGSGVGAVAYAGVAALHVGAGTWGKILGLGAAIEGGAEHLALVSRNDGSIAMYGGSGVGLGVGPLYGLTEPGLLRIGAYAYIETALGLDGADGWIEVRIDNAIAFRITGIATLGSGRAPVADVVWLYPQDNRIRYDDLYLNDDAGGRNDGFAGNVRISADFPIADGVSAEWEPDPVQANYRNVDQSIPDEDASFNFTTTSGARDQFRIGPLRDRGAGVLALEVLARVRKSLPAGDVPVNVSIRSGATFDAPAVLAGSGYAYVSAIYDADPLTTSGWLDEAIDVAQLGYRRTF